MGFESNTLEQDSEGVLLCPFPGCRFEFTHLNQVVVMGRSGEDGTVVPVTVKHDGSVTHEFPVALCQTIGRRHAIVLPGECEDGHRFYIAFIQHKGVTRVEVSSWSADDRRLDWPSTPLLVGED